jgi:uncharacterized protein YdhG (YjbR/CyaY superfamily)
MAETKKGFTAEEKAAMRDLVRERKLEERMKKDRKLGEKALLDAVKKMPADDRQLAEKLHAIVTKHAPELMPKTWYGMPAWANGDGKVVCYFQAADKFKSRYATFGFNDSASLDDGAVWATSWAVKKLTKADEKRFAELVQRALA